MDTVFARAMEMTQMLAMKNDWNRECVFIAKFVVYEGLNLDLVSQTATLE